MTHKPRQPPQRCQHAAAPWPACFAPLTPHQAAAHAQQRRELFGQPAVMVRWADEPAALTDIAAALDGTGPPVIVADGRVELLPRGGAQ